MLRFIICEDEPVHQKTLMALLDGTEFSQPVQVEVYDNGADMFDAISGNKRCDVLFLDIRLGEENGFDYARKIRSFDNRVLIIVTTTIAEYAMDGYDVDALDFLLKPIQKDRYERVINRIHTRLKSRNDSKQVFMKNGKRVVVDMDDVLYLESFGRKTCLYFADGREDSYYRTITELEYELGNGRFIRCHRSYIVNLMHIQRITQKSVELTGNKTVSVSDTKYKELYDAYTKYMLEG